MTESSNGKLEFTNKYQVSFTKKTKVFVMEEKEWNRLKRMINKSIHFTRWYDVFIGIIGTAAVSFFFSAFTTQGHKSDFFIIATSLFVITIIFICFNSRDKNMEVHDKEEIIDFMNEIHEEE